MVWNYFTENGKHSSRVVEYSLKYSSSTQVANYSYSTALDESNDYRHINTDH